MNIPIDVVFLLKSSFLKEVEHLKQVSEYLNLEDNQICEVINAQLSSLKTVLEWLKSDNLYSLTICENKYDELKRSIEFKMQAVREDDG